MTHKTLTPKQTYILSIAPNEEIIETVTKFVKEQKIKSGYILGLGAVKSARLGHYSVPKKKYTERKIKKPLEMTNLTGIISSDKIHVHATFASQMFKGYAGHLVRAVVSAACELIVVETMEEIGRKYSKEIGLDLLDL
jgi:predicted DNA-binding protein with PD1-like motif